MGMGWVVAGVLLFGSVSRAEPQGKLVMFHAGSLSMPPFTPCRVPIAGMKERLPAELKSLVEVVA